MSNKPWTVRLNRYPTIDYPTVGFCYRTDHSDHYQDDGEEFNTLVFGFGRWLEIECTLPAFVKRHAIKVTASGWSKETIERLGRDYYFQHYNRAYGIQYREGTLIVNYGIAPHHTGINPEPQALYWDIPWLAYTHISKEILDFEGNRVELKNVEDSAEIKEKAPKRYFEVLDYDNTKLLLETHIERRTWRRGTGWFKWLGFIYPKFVKTWLEVRVVDGELGPGKSDWKGGILGFSVPLAPGQTPLDALIHYGAKRSRNGEQYSVICEGEYDTDPIDEPCCV